MKALNEMVELAKRARVAGQGTPEMADFRIAVHPDTIIALGKEVSEMPTLRDQFAMAALAEIMRQNSEILGGIASIENVAESAYKMADAMMEARK